MSLEAQVGVHIRECSKCRCFSAFSRTTGLKKQLNVAALNTLCREGVQGLARHVSEALLREKDSMLAVMADSLAISVSEILEYPHVAMHRLDESFAALGTCADERDRILEQAPMREEMGAALMKLASIQGALDHWRDMDMKGHFHGKLIPHEHMSSVTVAEVEKCGAQLLQHFVVNAREASREWEEKFAPHAFKDVFSFFGAPLFDLDSCLRERHVPDASPLAGVLWQKNGSGFAVDLDDGVLAAERLAAVRAMTVVARVRPPLSHEAGDASTARVLEDGCTIAFKDKAGPGGPYRGNSEQTLEFDAALSASQAQLFSGSGVKALVHRSCEGYTSTIFAYGQTGAGKTFSLLGPQDAMSQLADDSVSLAEAERLPEACLELIEGARRAKVSTQGLLPRAAQYLFRTLQSMFPDQELPVIKTSFVELYNEKVFDLLNPAAGVLDVRQRANSDQGFHVPGRTDVACRSPAEVLRVLRQGVAVRHTSSHSLSRESSRAHAIFNMEFSLGNGKSGKLVFADLAGSERSKKAEGANVQETAAINKSLLMLSNCISALAGGDTRASSAFRNSKLTKMLMESLCGTGYTLLLAALSPAERHFDETANTLYFAAKCSNIKRQTQMNLSPHEKEVQALKETIRGLRRELAAARGGSPCSPQKALAPPDGAAAGVELAEAMAALKAERERNTALLKENRVLKDEVTTLQEASFCNDVFEDGDVGSEVVGAEDDEEGDYEYPSLTLAESPCSPKVDEEGEYELPSFTLSKTARNPKGQPVHSRHVG